ncbi:uncharacterized protein B0J16DRAFT_402884 [Fusarium flagelliforme]|uniref:uncharacterized protein n=1 Tax=Fusarium flagelliforme TaxID=2675880 RepID=UPI001E8E5C6E|nr:uncharacterized protein B0J16DRAFT_402884 [Fusarium flagelliforme]KAH7179532.1 hypothetical protein B0J16DRAFT_402884 [Fusarium flagelliforme]
MSPKMTPEMPPKKRYEFSAEQEHIVQQGEDDIATSVAGDRVYVDAPGRKWFRHVWLWDSDYTDDTTTTFEPKTHGPGVSKQSPLPGHSELQPHSMAMEMLEIGLVLADNPKKFHETVKGQTSRSKSRETARKERGTMARDNTWFRAYIKVTDSIQSQAKVFIGCRILDGHLRAITIEIKCIFFYKEFYPGVDVKNAKDRDAYTRQAIKYYAAKVKEPEPTTQASGDTNAASQALASEAALTSHPMDCVQTEDQLPPHYNNDSVFIFLAFDEKITLDDEDLANLIEIVQPQIGDAVQLQPDLIRTIYEVMCVEQIGEQTLGQFLPKSELAFFLELCHTTIELPCDRDSLTGRVHTALMESLEHAKHSIGSTPPSTSSNGSKRKHSDMST